MCLSILFCVTGREIKSPRCFNKEKVLDLRIHTFKKIANTKRVANAKSKCFTSRRQTQSKMSPGASKSWTYSILVCVMLASLLKFDSSLFQASFDAIWA